MIFYITYNDKTSPVCESLFICLSVDLSLCLSVRQSLFSALSVIFISVSRVYVCQSGLYSALSSFLSVIISFRHHVRLSCPSSLSSRLSVITQRHHVHLYLSLCPSIIIRLSSFHHVHLSQCPSVITPVCHHACLSSCPFIIMPVCHHVHLSSLNVIMSICHVRRS